MRTKSLGISTAGIIILIISILALIAVGYFGLRFLGVFDKNTKDTTGSVTTSSTSGKMDANLVGNWDTGCLIPDPDSPWAEEHTFTIDAKGKATHARKSGETCASLKQDNVNEFQISIPAPGQIDFIASNGGGGNIYDMYSVSGNTLKFGHGFCNCSTLCSKSGGSTEGDRISCLNNFLIYKK